MAQPIETRGLCPLRQPFGGFWRRVLASVIDGLVLIAILGAAHAVIDVGLAGSWPGPTVPWSFVWVSTGWLYFALMESSRLQATVGKLALSIRVTDLRGNRISFARASARWFAKALSALLLYVGLLMVAFTPRKRGLHDYLAGTLVCRSWVVASTAAARTFAGE